LRVLCYVSTAPQQHGFEAVRAQCPPRLRARGWLVSAHCPPTWLFADIERPTAPQAEHVAQVHAAGQAAGWLAGAQSHPRAAGTKLARLLHTRGINPLDVYRASDIACRRAGRCSCAARWRTPIRRTRWCGRVRAMRAGMRRANTSGHVILPRWPTLPSRCRARPSACPSRPDAQAVVEALAHAAA
jgi:hypothetical protein